MMSLDKIFGLYTIGFLGVTVLIGIGERDRPVRDQMIGWIFMALSLAIYVIIGILTRTSNPDQYYVAGPGRALCLQRHGHRLGLDVGRLVHLDGGAASPRSASSASATSWAGRAATCCSPSSSAPISASSAPTRSPTFWAPATAGTPPGSSGVVGAIVCSFTYLIAQVTGVGLIVARFIGIDYNIGVFVGPGRGALLLGARRHEVGDLDPGGPVHHPHHFLPRARRVPLLDALHHPHSRIDLRQAAPAEQRHGDRGSPPIPRRRRRARCGRRTPTRSPKSSRPGGLSEADARQADAQRRTGARAGAAPAPSETSKFGNTLTVPTGTGMWNFLALTFCLMVGTAGLPHILTRYYTTPSVKQARTSVAWSLFFIFLLYFTAPAYAAFARFAVFTRLVGAKVSELPGWVTFWQPAGLFTVVDKNGDGIVQWADFVVRSHGLRRAVDARGGGATVRHHGPRHGRRPGGGAFHRGWPAAHHRQRHLARPLLQRHRPPRVADQAADDHEGAARGDRPRRRRTSRRSASPSSPSWWPGPSAWPPRHSSRRSSWASGGSARTSKGPWPA